MDRPTGGFQLRWLLVPAAWVLLVSGLGLPGRAYTGLMVRPDGRVGSVDPGSPGALAGLHPGDRLSAPETGSGSPRAPRPTDALAADPLAGATPGVPLVVMRERAGASMPVWIAPRAQPQAERRLLAALFAVATAFMLLGGWVWSERRD